MRSAGKGWYFGVSEHATARFTRDTHQSVFPDVAEAAAEAAASLLRGSAPTGWPTLFRAPFGEPAPVLGIGDDRVGTWVPLGEWELPDTSVRVGRRSHVWCFSAKERSNTLRTRPGRQSPLSQSSGASPTHRSTYSRAWSGSADHP